MIFQPPTAGASMTLNISVSIPVNSAASTSLSIVTPGGGLNVTVSSPVARPVLPVTLLMPPTSPDASLLSRSVRCFPHCAPVTSPSVVASPVQMSRSCRPVQHSFAYASSPMRIVNVPCGETCPQKSAPTPSFSSRSKGSRSSFVSRTPSKEYSAASSTGSDLSARSPLSSVLVPTSERSFKFGAPSVSTPSDVSPRAFFDEVDNSSRDRSDNGSAVSSCDVQGQSTDEAVRTFARAMKEAETACAELRAAAEVVDKLRPLGRSLAEEIKQALVDATAPGLTTTSSIADLVKIEKRLASALAVARELYVVTCDKAHDQTDRSKHVCAIVENAMDVAIEACDSFLAVWQHLKNPDSCTSVAWQELKNLLARATQADVANFDVRLLKQVSHCDELNELLSWMSALSVDLHVPNVDLQEAEKARRSLHWLIQDLKGQVRVICRLRELSPEEVAAGKSKAVKVIDQTSLTVPSAGVFKFDQILSPGTQKEVFEECSDLVQSALDGRNVTIFTYGQTGSGKTFTMYGTEEQEGIAPRAISELFSKVSGLRRAYGVTVTASAVELYRTGLVDLSARKTAQPVKLSVKHDKDGSVQVQGLQEVEVADAMELHSFLKRSVAQRATASHAMNSQSSRSHMIFTIKVISVNRSTDETIQGKILLCDLAGAERIKKTEVEGERQKEAIDINKGLAALGNVIVAVARKQKPVPYRDHKLTQILSDSLGGRAKTLMIVNASPCDSDISQTVASLEYAARASRIMNKTAGLVAQRVQEIETRS